jgi:large subunit ribosomal protein L28
LPAAYRKFWEEWRIKRPTAVHFIPKEGKFERNPLTGEVRPIQNVPIPLMFPKESHDGIWGGEGIIKGFQKRTPYKRRVPHFWVPVLRRSVVYSEVLNEYLSVIVTDRTIDLIHECHGFDHYLLKTPACDLRSKLALQIKRKVLLNLQDGCTNWADQQGRQQTVLKDYRPYLEQYTAEEIEWYGLTFEEAILKMKKQIDAANPVVPHKVIFRSRLIEQLQEAGITEAQTGEQETSETSSWMTKINPFAKK